MDASRLPEPLRKRLDEAATRPPLETVSRFLGAYYNDAETGDEIRSILQRLASTNIRYHQEVLRALEIVIADPPAQPGTLSRLVEWDANWVLDDTSDAAALEFLREAARLVREVIDAAPATAQRWSNWPPRL